MKTTKYRPRKALIERLKRARLAGETVYRSGSPCRFGHEDLRFIANGNCRECGERYRAAYRAKLKQAQSP